MFGNQNKNSPNEIRSNGLILTILIKIKFPKTVCLSTSTFSVLERKTPVYALTYDDMFSKYSVGRLSRS